MAITLTQLAAALRLGDGLSPPEEPTAGILVRLLSVATAQVMAAAPNAPADVRDEAMVRYCSYLYDAAPASSGGGYAAAWRNSGAMALVSRWVVPRAIGAG